MHRPVASLHKTSVYHQEPQRLVLFYLYMFFDSQSDSGHCLTLHESPRTRVLAKNLFFQPKSCQFVFQTLSQTPRTLGLYTTHVPWAHSVILLHLFFKLDACHYSLSLFGRAQASRLKIYFCGRTVWHQYNTRVGK